MAKRSKPNEPKAKKRRKKPTIPKTKPRRIKRNSKKSPGKTRKKAKPTRKSKPAKRTKVRELSEHAFWKRSLRRKKRIPRARYATKSILSRDGFTKRKIRKKQTSTKKLTAKQVVRANKNFCVGEDVFARVAYKYKKEIKWASAPRQHIANEDDLEGVVELLVDYAQEYSERKNSIEGFDFEKTLGSEFYALQQPRPKAPKRAPKKAKKVRRTRHRNK